MSGIQNLRDGKSALVAEGDAALRDQLSAMLKTLGYHVISVRSGDEAIVLLDRSAGEIDIVYANVDLPKRSGLEVFLKAKSMKPGIRFILASEPIGEKTRQSLSRIGVRVVVEKPFTREQLLHSILKTLDSPSAPSIPIARLADQVTE
ncbi:MAG TPA: response regulator [Bacteroidota bacterium]|nr:response regulator [Bacteroidota bacterium]